MADDEVLPAALTVTTVQARRAQVGPGPDGDVVIVELGVEGAALPPLLVPVAAIAGLAAALLRAADPILAVPDGSAWAVLLATERVRADELARAALPDGFGAYVWFRQGVPIHLGRAVGKRGLRARIGGDVLQGDADLSRSPFRAAVADHLGFGVDDAGGTARLEPSKVARLDAWIADCSVAWLRAASPAHAATLEASLRADHDPAFD